MRHTPRRDGFALNELVMLLVVAGIVVAAAIPRFVDLRDDPAAAATQEAARALGSASAINFAVRSIDASNGVTVRDCAAVVRALEGGLAEGYAVPNSPIPAGASATCTVTGPGSTAASFVAHGVD
jgi:type II secretory pathway pseudopilin PulG